MNLSKNTKDYHTSGISLQENKYYRLKLAGDYNGWDEYTRYFHTYTDNVYINGETLNGNIYGQNIVLENTTVNQDINVVAGDNVDILPGSTLNAGTYEIDDDINCNYFSDKYINPSVENQLSSINEGILPDKELLSDTSKSTETKYTDINFIYLNPVNSEIKVTYKLPINNQYMIIIYDMIGRKLYANSFNGGNSSFEISNNNFNSGIFLYQITGENRLIKSGKFVLIK